MKRLLNAADYFSELFWIFFSSKKNFEVFGKPCHCGVKGVGHLLQMMDVINPGFYESYLFEFSLVVNLVYFQVNQDVEMYV